MRRFPPALRTVARVFLASALPLLIAACSNKSTPPPAGETSKPGGKNWYRFPLDQDAVTLDPAYITDTASDAVARQIFDGLVEFGYDNRPRPALAKKWSAAANGTAWTFELRPDVKFHGGRRMTAEDVIYSWKRLLRAPQGPRTSLLFDIRGAREFAEGKSERIDGLASRGPLTLEVSLERPIPFFLGIAAMSNAFVVDREAAEKWGADFARRPEGTGPFKFREWSNGTSIVLDRNPDYFQGAPSIEGVLYRILPSPRARLEEYKRGNLEHTDAPPEFVEAVRNDPHLSKQLVSVPLMDFYNIAFNTEKKPFRGNAALRRAFNHAVDKESLIRDALAGLVEETDSFVPRALPAHAGIPTHRYAYDPELARRLMAEAGHPGGEGIGDLNLFVTNDELHRTVAGRVQDDLKRVGVSIDIRALDWAALIAATENGEGELLQHTWLADYPDPDNFFFTLLHSSNVGPPGNISRYSNPAFDALAAGARGLADHPERMRMYSKAAEIAYRDAPWLFLYNNACLLLKQPWVDGLLPTGLDRAPRLPSAPLERVALRR